MVNEWRAIRRVGEWAGIEEGSMDAFLALANRVHDEKLAEAGDRYDLDHEYFEFLNEEVFSDQRIISQCPQFGVSDDILQAFRSESVPIGNAFEEFHVVDYDLNEIVDFVMLLKFVDEYLDQSGDEQIVPRNRLQHLLYLVNYQLSNQQDPLTQESGGLGMLSRTGYRYTFRKSEIGPASSWLYTDKDRLYAWQLLDETVIETEVADEDEPYGVALGRLGNIFMARFDKKLRNFQSNLLREWDNQQRSVIDEFADIPQSDLREYVMSIGVYQGRSEGQILLNGRPLRFDGETLAEIQPAAGVVPSDV